MMMNHQRRPSRRHAWTAAAAAIAAGALLLSGCAAGGGAAPTESAEADESCVEKAAAIVEEGRAVPDFPEPEPFDLPDDIEDRTYYMFVVSLAAASSAAIADGFVNAVQMVGAKSVVIETKGSPDALQQGINQAIAAQASGIVLSTTDPALAPNAVKAAADADIPVIYAFGGSLESDVPGVTANMSFDGEWHGRLGAAYIAEATDCQANVAQFTSLSIEAFVIFDDAYRATFDELCPDTCVYETYDFIVAEAATKLTPLVQSVLQTHPDVNFVALGTDSFAPLALAGIKAIGRTDLPLIAANGAALADAQKGSGLTADMVFPPQRYSGFLLMDMVLRAGEGPIDTIELPLRIVDESNWGTDPDPFSQFPSYADYEDAFAKAWGVD